LETSSLKERLRRLINYLEDGLIEREIPVRLSLLTAISGEHLLLIGSPGTAKSALARRLHLAFKHGNYFERLLTKFSVPEELFGPLSIKALEQDRYQRLTDRYLPSATIAFIDEIFKANSAILNSLLTLLNEREFDNGDKRLKVPLISVIGASNELPEEDELHALYDRFLCRYFVKPVSNDVFEELLLLNEVEPAVPDDKDLLDEEVISKIIRESEQVSLTPEVIELLKSLRTFLAENKLFVSDRRWRKLVKLLKVSAWTNEQQEVTIWDCWLLQHCVWDVPENHKLIAKWYETHMGIGSGFNPKRLEKLVFTWETACKADAESKTQLRNKKGEYLYLTVQKNETTEMYHTEWSHRGTKPLYMSPPDQDDRSNNGNGYTEQELKEQFFDDRYQQTHIDGKWKHINDYIADSSNRLITRYENEPMMEPTTHPASFIEARLNETNAIKSDIDLLKNNLQEQINSLDKTIGAHLWIESSYSITAKASLQKSLDLAESLSERMHAVIKQYESLPAL
jgi:MoxR-like ATPase